MKQYNDNMANDGVSMTANKTSASWKRPAMTENSMYYQYQAMWHNDNVYVLVCVCGQWPIANHGQ